MGTNLSKSKKEPAVNYSLPIMEQHEHRYRGHSGFACIKSSTLADLFNSMNEDEFNKKYLIVDCRYPYEYDGGHILHAVNHHKTSEVPAFFFPEDKNMFEERRSRIPIFYCEYSKIRGPSMAHALRKHDRKRNRRNPQMEYTYKEMYLLEDGYSGFFDQYKHLCIPQNYVPMNGLVVGTPFGVFTISCPFL